MERIVYNSKLKKIILSMFLFMIIFYSIFPNIVMAASWTDSIQGTIKSMNYLSNDSTPKTIADDLGRVSNQTEIDRVKNAIKDKIKEKFSGLTDDEIDKVFNVYKDDSDKAKVTVVVISPQGTKAIGTITVEVNMTQDDVDEALNKSDEEVDGLDESKEVETAPDSSAVGGGDEPPTSEGGNENGSDIGGLLLSPVFYLVNFIADAIIDSLGKIMTGNGVFSSGIGILQMSPVTSKYTKTSELTVYISNALGFIQYPDIKYTPEEIFSGEIDLLSIDFISGKDADGNEITGDWASIRKVVAQWYKILRMIAIIGLLSVLIYTGIKVMISANAKDKAKYKEWIINWFMAVAILFTMHYIMSFIVSVTGEFSTLLGESCQGITVKPDGSGTNFDQFDTNLMGLVRFMVQSEDFYTKIAYEVMYIALIVYTVKFTVIYLKRVLNMAFLTILAPIVALTYPIDKINDGQAQGFNMWLKEYIFNALLQPMHLILYYILMGSAVSIAASNPLYGIVVLMFMTEAEKLLKKIFGFDKAGGGTVGGMTGAFAAGAIASQVGKIAKMAAGGNGKKNGSGGNGSDNNNLMDNVKPEKDGSVEDDFADNGMLDSGDDTSSDNGEPSEAENAALDQYGKEGFDKNSEGHYFNPWTDEYDEDYDPTKDKYYNKELEKENKEEKEGSNPEVNGGSSSEANGGNGSGTNGESGSEAKGAEGSEADGEEGSDADSEEGSDADEKSAIDNKEPIRKKAKKSAFARGVTNVGKTLLKPVYDIDRKGDGYNAERWKRRGIKALKGAGKAAVGFSVGTAAAAVQAGISITDGKYNPMEGMATFAGGYAGGRKMAQGVGRGLKGIANSFEEGYYEGNNKKLNEKRMKNIQKEFMYDENIHKQYTNQYDEEYQNKHEHGKSATELKELASKHLVSHGIKDTKEQFAIQKMADRIFDNTKGVKNYSQEQKDQLLEKSIIQARKTKNFISTLEKQGQKSIIGDIDKQKKYVEAIIASRNYDKNNAEHKKEIAKIEKSYANAFKSAAVWQQVNKA